MKEKIKKIGAALAACAEDVLIILGLLFIAVATYKLSFVAGLYVTGVELLGLGSWFTVHSRPPKSKEK